MRRRKLASGTSAKLPPARLPPARLPSARLPSATLPSPLRLIIHAAELECPPGHAAALRELTTLALHKIPARGIFDPAARGEHELYAAIEGVAQAHLELKGARTAWRGALEAARLDLEQRDQIEHTALEVQSVSDT